MILYEMPQKTREEVEEYSKAFWNYAKMQTQPGSIKMNTAFSNTRLAHKASIPEIKNIERYVERVEKCELVIHTDLTPALIHLKRREVKALIKQAEDDDFTEEEDRFILRCLYKYGYNSWELMKNEINKTFNWRFLSKTVNDLRRRSDFLIEAFKFSQKEKAPKGKQRKAAKPKLKSKNSRSKVSKTSQKSLSKHDSEDEKIIDLKNDVVKSPKDAKMSSPETVSRKNTRPARNRKAVNYKES
jgi:hypothetical protein